MGNMENINLNKIFQLKIIIYNILIKTIIAKLKGNIAEDLNYFNIIDKTFDIHRIYKKINLRDRTRLIFT